MWNTIKTIWKDPVFSKLIAAAIITLVGLIINSIIKLVKLPIDIPLLYFIWTVLLFLLIIVIIIKLPKPSLTSNEWFAKILERLKNCKSVKIYLRDFDHPDNFKFPHRQDLMSIMEEFKYMIKRNADIKIISFLPSNKKNGLNWLQSELKECPDIKNSIRPIETQPVYNSSTVYIFDNNTIIYNKKKDNKTTYHIDCYNETILHHLVNEGFDKLFKELICEKHFS